MKAGNLVVLVLILCAVLTGCQKPENEGYVFDRFDATNLKFSNSAEVLAGIRKDDRELLSQSESVVASWGQWEKGEVLWFNMVTFDEEALTAIRKYGFLVDERQRGALLEPFRKQRFDAQMVLEASVIEEPYANENVRRIEILKVVMSGFSEDVGQLILDSRTLMSASMMVKQTLNVVLQDLDDSPALAAELTDLKGMKFDHPIFGAGRIRMLIESDIVKVKIKIGKGAFYAIPFEQHPDVIGM